MQDKKRLKNIFIFLAKYTTLYFKISDHWEREISENLNIIQSIGF